MEGSMGAILNQEYSSVRFSNLRTHRFEDALILFAVECSASAEASASVLTFTIQPPAEVLIVTALEDSGLVEDGYLLVTKRLLELQECAPRCYGFQ